MNLDYENTFFETLTIDRASKHLFQFEIFLKTKNVLGDIIEFGVFKGNSLVRLICYRNLYAPKKNIYAFDIFKKITPKKKDLDYEKYLKFLNESKNTQKTLKEIKSNLKKRDLIYKVNLIKGDITKKLNLNDIKKVSLVLLDVDLYLPSKIALNKIWGKLSKNGIVILDNYNNFEGETLAVNEFAKKNELKIHKIKRFRNFYYLKK